MFKTETTERIARLLCNARGLPPRPASRLLGAALLPAALATTGAAAQTDDDRKQIKAEFEQMEMKLRRRSLASRMRPWSSRICWQRWGQPHVAARLGQCAHLMFHGPV